MTVRFGIIGAAAIARDQMIGALRNASNCEITAIASRSGDRAAALAAERDIPHAYGSYAELLASDHIDAVYVPLPNHLHAEWSVRAVQAGKHVLCEKPLAMNTAQTIATIEAAHQRGIKIMEAFMYGFHPVWDKTRSLIDSGTIGEVTDVQATFRFFEDDPDHICYRPEFGGGALMDVGCYLVHVARTLLGPEPDTIEATSDIDPDTGVDLTTRATLGFGDRTARIECSIRTEPEDQTVRIIGTGGEINVIPPFNPGPDSPAEVVINADEVEVRWVSPVANHYRLMAEGFADAILSDKPVPVPNSDTIANMATIDAIRAAAIAPGSRR